ncbi:MAG: NINE protein [Bdellovibrionales bacterium]|nr:NINE protein [Bdellovibrionales bacterium]
MSKNTHSIPLGYILWLFGFTGAHRFYYGKPITGVIWFCTLGLLGVGWLIDIFLIPGMDREAERRYGDGLGTIDYNIAWLLLTFLGLLGVHRLYMRKYLTAVIWFFTGGLFLVGYLYDFLTLNDQIHEIDR